MFFLYFYAPVESVDLILDALFKVGAGRIGNYDSCVWRTDGIGQFRPLQGSHPFTGNHNQLHKLPETRVELVCSDEHIDAVIQALHTTHPYEVPAFGAIPLYTGRTP